MLLKIGERRYLVSEWNPYIVALKSRVMQRRGRLQSEIAYHSTKAHQIGIQKFNKLDTIDSRFDEIESMIVGLGPATIAQMQRDFEKTFSSWIIPSRLSIYRHRRRPFFSRNGKMRGFGVNHSVGSEMNNLQDGKPSFLSLCAFKTARKIIVILRS
jgi:hypothetical protein